MIEFLMDFGNALNIKCCLMNFNEWIFVTKQKHALNFTPALHIRAIYGLTEENRHAILVV